MVATADPMATARSEFERVMARGVKGFQYFSSPAPVVGATPKDVLLERGTMRVYHYKPRVDDVYRIPVLLVMAPTNRGFIFDLVAGQSLVEFLLDRGFDVFMLDWDPPRRHEKHLALEDYVLDFIPSAIRAARDVTGEMDVNVVGYCFGGVLSLLYAALRPEGGIANLAALTTPIDFSKMETFGAWADRRFFDVDRVVDTFGNVPGDVLYSSFDLLRPGARTAGNVRLLDNLWNDEYVRAFRVFERWNTDVLPLPGAYFKQMVKLLMWDNALLHGRMPISGELVNLRSFVRPFLHVGAEHDHIVPRGSSAPLFDMIGSTDKKDIVLKGGHVSLVAGPNAVRRMWPALAQWLSERST